MGYTDENAATWDRWVEEGIEWGMPISHAVFEKAVQGEWNVFLTPTEPVPHAWFPPMRSASVLGLASGGGQQIPVFAALGARCTVLDYSERQLETELMVAEREGYAVETVCADMTKPLPFADAQFDLIFHPVSNCYIEEILPLWRECFRVLRPGGILLAGQDNGMNFLIDADEEPLVITNRLPFNPLRNPEQMALLKAEDGGVEFSHSLTEMIGGQLEAGFRLTHLYEDRCREGQGALRDYAPQFFATRALKP